jgi:S-adenosylhomocysteine hydrolase
MTYRPEVNRLKLDSMLQVAVVFCGRVATYATASSVVLPVYTRTFTYQVTSVSKDAELWSESKKRREVVAPVPHNKLMFQRLAVVPLVFCTLCCS